MGEGDNIQGRDAIKQSIGLSRAGETGKGLELVDAALADAILKGRKDWIARLSRHASIMAESLGDLSRAKKYYERCLHLVPDDPFVLCGLARILGDEGQADSAKQYATKAYEISMERATGLELDLVEMILM